MEINSFTPKEHFFKANEHYKNREYSDAEREYRNAIEKYSSFSEAHYNLANLLLELNRKEEAKDEYRRALKIDSDFVEANCNLGILLSIEGKYEESYNLFEKVIKWLLGFVILAFVGFVLICNWLSKGPPSDIDPSLWEFAKQVERSLADKDVEFFIAKTITQEFETEAFTMPLYTSPELERLITSYPSPLSYLRRELPPEFENDPKKKFPGVLEVIPSGFVFPISIEQYRKRLQKMFVEAKSEERDMLGTGKFQLHGITKASTLVATYITIDDLAGKYREIVQFFLEKHQGEWYISGYARTFGTHQYMKTNTKELKEWETLSDYIKWPNFR